MEERGATRREFMKLMAATGVALGAAGPLSRTMAFARSGGKEDIGLCKSVKITCISETSWFDGNVLMKNMKDAGGPKANQWIVDWDQKNSGGYSSLIEIEGLDGSRHRFLLDTGWNNSFMDKAFEREGIGSMLKKGEIEFLYVTHEHFDHFFGIESVLRHDPQIKVIIPNTFYDEGYRLLAGAEFEKSKVKNSIPYKGTLVKHDPAKIYRLYPGCASVTFDLPIPCRTRGEQSLYFNVKDKGIVCVTGCCHQNIIDFAEFARTKLEGGQNLYGLYGGLHIAPVGPLSPEGEKTVREMARFGFRKIACNHCTGVSAVEKMVELGYPVVKGSGRHGSPSKMYLGNGDVVVF
ncbi:MAG: MBL fold metallo-hydrolase [Syntrophorhabdus sp.]|nr:MBL fold metallo-hydrolase [Syntrophorhabdus sp.]